MKTFVFAAQGDNANAAFKVAQREHPLELGDKVGVIGVFPPRNVKPSEFVETLLKRTDNPVGWPRWQLAGGIRTGIGQYLFFGWVAV